MAAASAAGAGADAAAAAAAAAEPGGHQIDVALAPGAEEIEVVELRCNGLHCQIPSV